ncbi:MAG: hypothetical protein LBL93_01730, partial [Ruminococcus sp.]|nr:hypothetical protein [Ruminococcus sp.]
MKKIKKILERKLELLYEYQKITDSALNYSEFDDVLPIIDSRDKVINELININTELDNADEYYKMLLNNECNFGELNSQEQEIFSLAQNIRTLVYKLRDMDSALIEKIKLDKADIEFQILEQYKGQYAYAAIFWREGL